MPFHYTKVVQRDRPKPHLRLHVMQCHDPTTDRAGLAWRAERIEIGTLTDEQKAQRWAPPVVYETTAWWPTSRLALDAAFYQFACEWPAGRP